MAAMDFSWSDTFHVAFGSCLSCLPSHSNPTASSESLVNPNDPTYNRVRRARPDELEGLLADTGTDTDPEAETMSLHSNPGSRRKRSTTKAKKNGSGSKRITIFGYNLFGRPPIQLPEDDDDVLQRPHNITPTTTRSTSTFDSDAAPLDPETIDQFSATSAQLQAERALAEEREEQRLKEERRQRRRERKEMKRIAQALALGEEERFEGFQGSGVDVARAGYPSTTSPNGEEYGPFRGAPRIGNDGGDDDDDADLDGSLYARNKASSGTSNSGGGSEPRSRTSGSGSQVSSPRSQLQGQFKSPQHPRVPAPKINAPPLKTKKLKSSKSRSSASASTSTTTDQSPSLASSIIPSFPETISSSPMGDFRAPFVREAQEFGDDDFGPINEGYEESTNRRGGFPSQGFGRSDTSFPSPGFGRGFGGKGAMKAKDFGAFLARRGDDDDV